jgi:glycosyltransferase involved in cell wall biosynthesis
MKISVVICAHNEQDWIQKGLKSLASQTRVPDEVIVVDNASTDRTAEIVTEFASQSPINVRVVNESHKGLHYARETGWRAASGDLILVSDADILFPPKWVQKYEAFFNANPDIAAASGPVRYYDALPFINWMTAFYEWFNRPIGFRKRFTKEERVSGGNCAIRRIALETIDGYKNKPDGLLEDQHISAKLNQAKLGIKFNPSNPVQHTFRRFNEMGWRGYMIYMFAYTAENVYPDHLKD